MDLKKERIAIDETSPVTPMTALVIDADGHLTYMGEDGCAGRLLVIQRSWRVCKSCKGRTALMAMAIGSCSWSRQISQDQPKISSFFGAE